MFIWIIVFSICLLILLRELIQKKVGLLCGQGYALRLPVRNNGIRFFLSQKNSSVKFYYKSGALIVLLLILAFIVGVRYQMGGTDYIIYETSYDSLPKISTFIKNFISIHSLYQTFGHEEGWLLAMAAAKTLGLNFNAFLFINSVFFFSCLYKFLKRYSINPALNILIFLYTSFFYWTMVAMRQSVTLGIFLLIIPFIEKGRFFKYFFWVLIAVMFHRAAIILILPYILYRLNFKRRFFLFLIVASIPLMAISFFGINVLLPFKGLFSIIGRIFGAATAYKFAALIDSYGTQINILHTFQFLAVLIIFYCFYNKLKQAGLPMKLCSVMLIMLYFILILFNRYEILTRIKDYFYVFYGIILGYFCLINKCKYRNIIYATVICVCALGFFRYIFMFDEGHFMNYHTVFFK